MCGIVGFITTESANTTARRKYLQAALIADIVRGEDGTGVMIVKQEMKEDEVADWVRIPSHAYDLMCTKEYNDRLGVGAPVHKYRAVIGHNRAATIGDNTINNTHPFQEGPITLVHNGTVHGTHMLPKTMHELKVQVDSHAICHNLATHSAEELIPMIDGAFALVWHDARDNTVNIVRNDERPLHLAVTSAEDTVLIASEASMLRWVAERSSLPIITIVQPEPGVWLKFLPGTTVPELKTLKLGSFRGSHRGYWHGGYYGRDMSDLEDWPPHQAGQKPTAMGSPATKAGKKAETMEETFKRLNVRQGVMYEFLPSRYTPIKGTKWATVNGWLPSLNKSCEIRGVPVEEVKDMKDLHRKKWGAVISGVIWPAERGDCVLLGVRRSDDYLSAIKSPESLFFPGPDGRMVPQDTIEKLTAGGCHFCKCDLGDEDPIMLEWTDKGEPVCQSCQYNRWDELLAMSTPHRPEAKNN